MRRQYVYVTARSAAARSPGVASEIGWAPALPELLRRVRNANTSQPAPGSRTAKNGASTKQSVAG